MMLRFLVLSLALTVTTVSLPLTPADAAAPARQQTITLDVDNMTCQLCPITVRKALRKVDGVMEVMAKYEDHGIGWAKVTFDPSRTSIKELTRATTMAGYPSRVRP